MVSHWAELLCPSGLPGPIPGGGVFILTIILHEKCTVENGVIFYGSTLPKTGIWNKFPSLVSNPWPKSIWVCQQGPGLDGKRFGIQKCLEWISF